MFNFCVLFYKEIRHDRLKWTDIKSEYPAKNFVEHKFESTYLSPLHTIVYIHFLHFFYLRGRGCPEYIEIIFLHLPNKLYRRKS